MISSVLDDFVNKHRGNDISSERKKVLDQLTHHISYKVKNSEPINLNFICTHNSRRSHLSQIMAQTMASHFKIGNVNCYSGGTEATAVYPMVIETLRKIGFSVQQLSHENNPIYAIKFAASEHPVIAFSKKFEDSFNPKKGFATVMTCSHADENCPMVFGADDRISITYNDPKAFDNSPLQAEKYLECAELIANEMYYVFQKVEQAG